MTLKKISLLLVICLVVFQGYRIHRDAGVGLEIEPLGYGQCTAVFGPSGPEDIVIDAANEVAFISADDRRFNRKQLEVDRNADLKEGGIWLLDLAKEDTQALSLNADVGPRFHPHGIDLLTLADGKRELYVINHRSTDEHEVIIFNVADDHSLNLKRRISYPQMISPNDIVALGEERFFVTNDHGSPSSSFMHTVEEYLGLARSSVTYFDGQNGSYLLKGINSANGIEVSNDMQNLYVAEAIGRSVRRYERHGSDLTSWKLIEKLDAGTAVDNLSWADDHTLLAGAHPKLFDFISHAKDDSADSPSQVISIDVGGEVMVRKTVYMDEGAEISGASVATQLNGELLIGAVFENFFLRCKQG
ncbi:MAG: hypothetical protein MK188_08765 [Gammaproteobacteria bacterium]|nr:hypothetical protein [Gammaproteobacteria bacterium]